MSTCGYSRCRFLTAWNEDRDAFFLYYKDDFNFEQEVVSLWEVSKKQIAEEEKKEYVINFLLLTMLLDVIGTVTFMSVT